MNAASITFRTNEDTGSNEAVRTTIFGILPSVTYNFKVFKKQLSSYSVPIVITTYMDPYLGPGPSCAPVGFAQRGYLCTEGVALHRGVGFA